MKHLVRRSSIKLFRQHADFTTFGLLDDFSPHYHVVMSPHFNTIGKSLEANTAAAGQLRY